MSRHNSHLIGPARRRITMVVCAGTLAVVGSVVTATSAVATTPDDSTAESTSDSASAASAAPAEIQSVEVILTESSIDGLPSDLVAGVVDVTVSGGSGQVSFNRVEPGSDAVTFAADLISIFEREPFPDYYLNMAQAVGHSMLTLDEGEYIVSTAPAQQEVTAEDIITAPLTVGPGDDDAVIPPTDGGSIRAGDYLFDVDVTAGGSTVTFTNSSDNQFHHVFLIDFGSNDPAVVEENFPAILESEEDDPLPEGIDGSQINFEFARSGVFGPGGSGTFDAAFEEGHTYVAVCYVHDREGGPPHAIQHQMYDVFQVD
jgi:hypothetical protein